MRTLVVLYMALTMGHWWLWQLLVLALAWDIYETMKPQLKIITQTSAPNSRSAPMAPPGMGDRIAQLLETRKQCADSNNCPDCQAFLAKFQTLMIPSAAEHPEPTPVDTVPPIVKNGGAYDSTRGYL